MFLETIRRRNPKLIERSIAHHQKGAIPANCYVIDLDAVESNARLMSQEAAKRGLKIFAMTKQMGRNSSLCAAIARGGISKAVTVDMECARACRRAGLGIGHLGHLVQIPRHETDAAARFQPDYWTVFSMEKACEATEASSKRRRTQDLLARIRAPGDQFYRGHEGGFPAESAVALANEIDRLKGGRFAGLTTFPALLFDETGRKVTPTHNLWTLARARDALVKAGRGNIEINAPGTTSSTMIGMLADAGATQVEPGHGLTGTTPLHAVEDLPERPAVIYVSEVSHFHGSEAYCFGGGLYIDPVFPNYQVKAIVSREPTVDSASLAVVDIPVPAAIDYYGMIDATGSAKPRIGDSVVFGFRPQAFVTRAYTVGISGLGTDAERVERVHHAIGLPADWPV